jgi:putative transposase
MQIGNRFRCYPSPLQEQILLRWIGCQRYIYNAKVQENRYFRSFARKSLQHAGHHAPIDQQYSQFKSELTPWLSEVPGVVLRNGAVLWKQAYSRYFAKLAGRPTIQQKNGKQSVWLTSELFRFEPVLDPQSDEILAHRLHIGIKKFQFGVLDFKAHNPYLLPASIHISVQAGRWHVSFNYDDQIPEPSVKEITEWLRQFDETELRKMTVGLDRGVALPIAGSDRQQFVFSATQQKRLADEEKRKKRWQRRQARRIQGSAGWHKAKRKVARYQRYGTDVRRDVAHKTSCALTNDPRYKLYVFEDLQVKNMTKKAKPKQDVHGCWLRNGAAAKSGLNKSILTSTWGQTKVFLSYKARRQGKLLIEVPPFYSSQECAACGHVHQDNRISQAEFVCLSCGNTDHADYNAAKVIAMRGIRQLLAGKCVQKEKKRCGITKSKVGAVGSEPVAVTQSTPGEIKVSRLGGNTPALWSLIQETPATSPVRL